MALFLSQTHSTTGSIPSNRTHVILTTYVVLLWFGLALLGSLTGAFVAQPGSPPLGIFLSVVGPVLVFIAGYLLSSNFRSFVRTLVGDSWGITALQASRVIGIVFVVQTMRHALPAAFALPAGLGDTFIGLTAPLAVLAWASGSRSGKVAFVLWNILGILDLLLAVSLGVLVASIPPTTASLGVFPLSLIPTFGVPLAFIMHFTGLAQLWHQEHDRVSLPA